jgi:hypothetical protein
MSKRIKNIIIIVVIIAVLGLGYNFFFNAPAAPALVSTAGVAAVPGQVENPIGQEFLTTLLNIRSIKLDDSIFANPAFLSLSDFTTTLVPEGNEGRSNPFAPIGSE